MTNLIDGLDDSQKEIIARFQGSLPDEPVDIYAMADELGCEVFTATMPKDRSGAISHKDGKFRIHISNVDSENRQRFTCAHELAHFLLHSDIVREKPLYENTLLRGTMSNPQEVEANALAADLLMPFDVLHPVVETRKYGINELAKKFGVTRAAMLVRLGIPGYSSPGDV